jgi:colanic acid/amylovoran biosynthesis glycosyltransferase
MRIAIVVQGFPKLSETFVLNHIKGLLDKGHEVNIFATSQEEKHLIHPDAHKYEVLKLTFFSPTRENGFKRLFKIFKNTFQHPISHFKLLATFNPIKHGKQGLLGYLWFDMEAFAQNKKKSFDIIHCHFGNNAKTAIIAKKLGYIEGKVIVHFHGHDLLRDDFIKAQHNYKTVIKFADGIIFNSQFLKDVFLSKFQKTNSIPSAIIHAPIDVNNFSFLPKVKTRKIFNIVTVGRLVSWKGQVEVIHSLALLLKKQPSLQLHYHIVGDGEDFNKLTTLISQLHLEQYITLWGAQKQDFIRELLSTTDLFVLFGLTNKRGEIDTQGVVIQEASAMGIPVIISDAGGMHEGVINGETGLIVPEGDRNELAQTLFNLYQNPELLMAMKHKGPDYIKVNFDIVPITNQTLEFYSQIINC